jgi:hypothetical protein
MARNEVFRDADYLSLPVPDGTVSGAAVRIGELNGVTATAEGGGGNSPGYASVWLRGAHDLLVATSTTRGVGDPVYITAGGVLTPASADGETDNGLFGHALSPKDAEPGLVSVRLANRPV